MPKFRVTVHESYVRPVIYEVETKREGVDIDDDGSIYHPEIEDALFEGNIQGWVQVEEGDYVLGEDEPFVAEITKISDEPYELSTLDSLVKEVEELLRLPFIDNLDPEAAFIVGKIAGTAYLLKKESGDASTS